MQEPKLWERQKENGRWESTEAYRAFQVYLDLGPSRGLYEVGLRIYPPGRGRRSRTPGRISAWSRKWSWVERAAAWDEQNEGAARQARREEVVKMQKRHAQQAAAAGAALSTPIRELIRRVSINETDLANLSVKDLLKLSALASQSLAKIQQAERIARLGGDGTLPVELVQGEERTITKVQWVDPDWGSEQDAA